MRYGALAALAMLAAGTAHATEVEVASTIESVTVYPDGASVTRLIRAELGAGDATLIARDLPLTLDPASLRIEGEGGARVLIGSIEAEPQRPEQPAAHPELEQRLEGLRDQRAALDDAVAAATLRKRFVERFATEAPFGLGEKGDARPLAEWRAAFAAVGEEMALADAALREGQRRQRDLDREIAQIEGRLKDSPPRRMQVRIHLAADAAGPAAFRVTYAVSGARWTPLYDARLDSGNASGKPTLQVIRRAEISQQTGEDWANAALSVSTMRTARGATAPELPPLIVRLQPERLTSAPHARDRAARQQQESMPQAAPAPAEAMAVKEREAVAETGLFQAVFRIPGRVSIPSREGATALRIASAEVEPELLVRAVPAVSTTAYLEASFPHAEDAPLLPGRVALYRDGVFVGHGRMRPAAKEETVRLGFGADERVSVERVAIRRSEGSSGIITSSKTDERAFRTTVRNGHARPVRIAIEDRLPVSETEQVTVEVLSATTPPTARDVDGRRGVLSWTFDAAPSETREITLAWRLRWPADRQVSYGPGAR